MGIPGRNTLSVYWWARHTEMVLPVIKCRVDLSSASFSSSVSIAASSSTLTLNPPILSLPRLWEQVPHPHTLLLPHHHPLSPPTQESSLFYFIYSILFILLCSFSFISIYM